MSLTAASAGMTVNATSMVSIADVNFARMSAMTNHTFARAAFQPADARAAFQPADAADQALDSVILRSE